jgi:phosphotransferase system  glucose/maltose/N-acetylglucosamine-specific IIC component
VEKQGFFSRKSFLFTRLLYYWHRLLRRSVQGSVILLSFYYLVPYLTPNDSIMTIPVGLILIFFSLATFYYFNQKRKINRENRLERLEEKREELLNALRNAKGKKRLQEEDNNIPD